MDRPLLLTQDERRWLINQVTYAINDIGVLMTGAAQDARQSYKDQRAALRVLLTKLQDSQ